MECKNRDDEIRTIEDSIGRLKQKLDALIREDDEDFRLKAKSNIGRCFKLGGTYVKIIDAPQREWCGNRMSMNQYQYPAVYVCTDESEDVPFDYDTFFSGDFNGDTLTGRKERYEEISLEEFNTAFINELNRFKDSILAIGAE